MLARSPYWMKRGPRDPAPEVILARVRPMPFISAMLSLAFGIWGLIVFENGNPAELDYAILFGSLTALGCAYGLASFPNVARMPLVFLALPLAARLVRSEEHTSELQSLMRISYAVFCLKKKQNTTPDTTEDHS